MKVDEALGVFQDLKKAELALQGWGLDVEAESARRARAGLQRRIREAREDERAGWMGRLRSALARGADLVRDAFWDADLGAWIAEARDEREEVVARSRGRRSWRAATGELEGMFLEAGA